MCNICLYLLNEYYFKSFLFIIYLLVIAKKKKTNVINIENIFHVIFSLVF